MKILNFGSINIDNVYSLDKIVSPGETVSCRSYETFPGGKGLNQSIAAARAGAKVYHCGCVGRDGEAMTDILRKNGVDTSYVKRVSINIGHAIIQVESSGQNSIIVFPGTNAMVSRDYIDAVLDDFDSRDILLFAK